MYDKDGSNCHCLARVHKNSYMLFLFYFDYHETSSTEEAAGYNALERLLYYNISSFDKSKDSQQHRMLPLITEN